MDKEKQSEDHIPAHEEESRKAGEKSREELDKIPPPGTDTLHEGP